MANVIIQNEIFCRLHYNYKKINNREEGIKKHLKLYACFYTLCQSFKLWQREVLELTYSSSWQSQTLNCF